MTWGETGDRGSQVSAKMFELFVMSLVSCVKKVDDSDNP